jgi:hypothetical protein
MKHEYLALLRKALLPIAATGVAVGAFLGLPALKALAAPQSVKINPLPSVRPPVGRLISFQPSYVNPSAARLVAIADEALLDQALAERIFNEPDAVASKYNLSDQEKLVLSKMTREQFEAARADAAQVSATRLSQPGANALPGTSDARLIAERMIVGRAILAAMGRSYLDAANAHACCPWGKAIELGLNGKRVLYDRIFDAPAGIDVRQPAIEIIRPDLQAPKPN